MANRTRAASAAPLALAIAALSPPGESFAASWPEWTASSAIACAAGYHDDPRGDCQPDNGWVDGRCQMGFVPQSFPNGNGTGA